ncbi:MAG: MOSC domain-containing protein [Gemmatimonadota bacterium]
MRREEPRTSPEFRVRGLFIYPLKSAAGIGVSSAEVDAFGLRHDRRWTVIGEDGRVVTQREVPRLALVSARVEGREGGALRLDAPGRSSLAVPAVPEAGSPEPLRIWGHEAFGWRVDPAADGWLTAFLGLPCRLLYMPGSGDRVARSPRSGREARVAFADAFPFHLISSASLEALNRRSGAPIPMNRFRPNLVVEGCTPHEEDRWRSIRIGDTLEFEVAKPCPRCSVPAVDQATGQRAQDPLRILASYRTWEGKVYFGQNLLHTGRGTLRVGDAVEVLELGEPEPPCPAIDLTATC